MSGPVYRFGDFSVDPALRELRHDGQPVPLSPMVFDCIVYLIEHRDRAVGRDELIAAVWGKVDVAYGLLGQIIVKARRALDDDGENQAFIRTIPRYGYRWASDVAVVTEAGAAVAASPAGTDERPDRSAAPAASASRSRRARARAGLLAVAVAIAAAASWFYVHRLDPTALSGADAAQQIEADMIAVLPVEIAASDEWSWARLGLMNLIADRMRAAGLAIVPSDNVVALLREGGDDGTASVRMATRARRLVTSTAAQSAHAWQVRLTLDFSGQFQDVAAEDADLIAATRTATDRLLGLLGRRPPESPGGPADAWLSRAQGALLADDFTHARALLSSAPVEILETPEVQLRLAEVDERAGRFGEADVRLAALLSEPDIGGEPVLHARVLAGRGRIALRQGKVEEADALFENAIVLLENRNEPADLGRAYTGRGVVHALRGEYEQANVAFGQARVALDLAGDALALARVESNEGVLEVRRNHHAAALPVLERSIRRFEQFGLPNEIPIARAAQIEIHLALLDNARALALAEPAVAVLRKPYAPPQQILLYHTARALTANGRLDEARGLLAELATLAPVPMLAAQIRFQQARLDFIAGNAQSAASSAQQVVNALAGPEYERDQLDASLLLVRALTALGLDGDADEAAARMAERTRLSDNPVAAGYGQLALAERAWAQGRFETAEHAYREAMAVVVEVGVPVDIAAVALSYGDRLIAAGRAEDARALVGRLGRWTEQDFDCALLQARLYHRLRQPAAWRSALNRARALAGERPIPVEVQSPPATDASSS